MCDQSRCRLTCTSLHFWAFHKYTLQDPCIVDANRKDYDRTAPYKILFILISFAHAISFLVSRCELKEQTNENKKIKYQMNFYNITYILRDF